MKKIIRLTESDLVRLVKRVIKEESSSAAAALLPIFIKMMPTKNAMYKAKGYGPLNMFYDDLGFNKEMVHDWQPILVNVVRRVSDEAQGCVFTAMVKGQSDQIKLRINCEPTYDNIVEIIAKVGTRDKEDSIYFDVSKEAMQKLKSACACSAYVSNQNKDSVPPVGNSNSYV